MLKIRDDVDLKELEKFGFEKVAGTYRYSSKPAKAYVYECVVYLYDYERIIRMKKLYDEDKYHDDCIILDGDELDILYDLIKANLVVKE